MVGDYEVFFGNQQAGRVQVTRQGLYYRFVCRCKLTGDVVCRLYVSCGGQQENQGVVVPTGDGFGLDTRFPISRVGRGVLSFCILPRHDPLQGRLFVPITPEEPFAYLSRLKDAFLETRNGQIGAAWEDGK